MEHFFYVESAILVFGIASIPAAWYLAGMKGRKRRRAEGTDWERTAQK